MSSVAHRKHAIESRLGSTCEFRTANTDTGARVELHSASKWSPDDEFPRAAWCRDDEEGTSLLGAGNNHHAALSDAEDTLRARGVPEARGSRHGVYANPRRKITAPAEVFAAQDNAAQQAGKPWSQWALDVLSEAAQVTGSES